MEYRPYYYQEYAEQFILDNPEAGLLLDMGMGKTVVSLTAADKLLNDYFAVRKVLVIAPLKPAKETWLPEIKKWDHLQHLTTSLVIGSKQSRVAALEQDADIYIINRENVAWLTNELSSIGNAWDFDMVVIDELSSFKSSKSQRFKALKKYITLSKRVVGLTGTPAPNGLIDLWSQIYLLDSGERLGRTVSGYRERYFLPDKRNQTTIFSYKPKEESEKAIYDKISDICVSMSAEDWLEMPERIDTVQHIKLSDKELKLYEEFEKEQYLEFINGQVTAATAAALTNKLLQFSNGAMYLDDGSYKVTSDKKLEALAEIVDTSQGQPILCFYSYRHDCERILRKFKGAKKLESADDIRDWNDGKIPLLLAHPAGAGHGLNLQTGGNIIVWFGLTWSLELYQQANARLYRQGQKNSVIIHHLVTDGTVDKRVLDSLQGKREVQDELLESLKEKYGV